MTIFIVQQYNTVGWVISPVKEPANNSQKSAVKTISEMIYKWDITLPLQFFFTNQPNTNICLFPVLFCCVLYPSSVQGLATPWTYFFYLCLSPVILIDSSTVSPVHVLMLSIQAVYGLSRMHSPGIVSCIISFSSQLPCFLVFLVVEYKY